MKNLMKMVMFSVFAACLGTSSAFADELTDLIKKQLEAIDKEQFSSMETGRMSYNMEMARNPGQLARDITRMPVNIGSVAFKNTGWLFAFGKSIKNKTAIEVFNMEAEELIKLIKSKNKSFSSEDANRIGRFWNSEIFYALSQSLMNPVIIKSQNDNTAILTRWGSSIADETNSADINYSVDDNVITVTQTRNKVLKDTFKKDSSKKLFTLSVKTSFHIATGKVWWDFSYSLDGKKEAWTTYTF